MSRFAKMMSALALTVTTSLAGYAHPSNAASVHVNACAYRSHMWTVLNATNGLLSNYQLDTTAQLHQAIHGKLMKEVAWIDTLYGEPTGDQTVVHHLVKAWV